MDPRSRSLPAIPAKRYFTIGEVSELCGVKPHVLRYWEQEFTQLKPVKRRGNRRYYQHHEVLLIRRIRELLYDQGFTISGARNRLDVRTEAGASAPPLAPVTPALVAASAGTPLSLRQELQEILALLDTQVTNPVTIPVRQTAAVVSSEPDLHTRAA
ncbi:MAG: MerR family transcriptional regulator [Burkholderiales bacterium]